MSERLEQIKKQAAGLPPQFEARAWNDMTDSMIVGRRMREAAIESNGANFDRATASAKKYLNLHGSLEGWTPLVSLGRAFKQIDEEAAAKRRELIRTAGFQPRYATEEEIRKVLTQAHEVCMTDDEKPSASALFRQQCVSAKDANKLASRPSPHTGKVWRELESHPARTAMREQGVLSHRKERAAVTGSIAGTVASLYDLAGHTKDRQRLSNVESEMAQLKAQLAALSQRQTITESGEHWHDIAKRMRAGDASYGDIAKATGQSRNTIVSYLRRLPV